MACGLVERHGHHTKAVTAMIGSDSLASVLMNRRVARSRDRRSGLGALLARVVTDLDSSGEARALLVRFEEGLRQLLPVRQVHVRVVAAGEPTPIQRPGEHLVLEVPTAHTTRRAFLEVTLLPARPLDDWETQLLHTSTFIAALAFEIESARGFSPSSVFTLVRGRRDGAAPLIGSSPQMRVLRERIERVAATDFTVLVQGESGAGKELVARQIHELSRRRRGPFVAVNCAALVESLLEAELFGIEDRTATGVRGRRGKFEHADTGTLFLDEVGDLSLTAQAKLLRAIQDLAVERVGGQGARRIDTRIVVATNQSLGGLVERGRFRADLFYRLNGVEISVPPLRARREDILELAGHFLDRYRTLRPLRLSPVAADALTSYEWPGNVRELERVIERAVALAERDVIALDDLPPAVSGDYRDVLLPSLGRDESLRTWASRYVRLVLDRSSQNKRVACEVLGISFHTLQSYLRQRLPSNSSAGDPVAPRFPKKDS